MERKSVEYLGTFFAAAELLEEKLTVQIASSE